jgi:DNA-directed RNA polymerase subunit RPC12/RpoP
MLFFVCFFFFLFFVLFFLNNNLSLNPEHHNASTLPSSSFSLASSTIFQIQKDGEYPTGACTACLDSLTQCMDFRKQVQESFGSITAGGSYAMAVEKPKIVRSKPSSGPKTASNKGLYKCHKCLKGFSTKKDVTFHLTKGTCQFSCPECSLIFGKKPFFDYHMKSEHQEPEEIILDDKHDVPVVEQVQEAPPPAAEIEVVKIEMMDYTEKEPEEYKCVECNLTFATETSLTAHKIRKHNQKIEMFPCQVN